jgi:hypothetical protein
MSKQRLHPNLNEIDLLTGDELHDKLGHHFSAALRDRFRTIKVMKLPQLRATATSATVNLSQGQGYADSNGTPCGPGSGFIWMLRRVMVGCNVATDTAHYQLYSGSDVTLFDSGHLLEGFTGGVAAVTAAPNGGSVPATGVAYQNPYSQPVIVTIAANGATITGVSVNGVVVGTAAGTYYVPAYGSISVAYSITVPTWTWTGTTTPGAPCGVGYYPGTKADWLWPSEQVYAQITGATVGNQYVLSGVAIECAAEMQGKLAG